MESSDLILDSDVGIQKTPAQREGQKTVLDIRNGNDSISNNFIPNATQMKIPSKDNEVSKSNHIVNLRCSVETKGLDVDQRT